MSSLFCKEMPFYCMSDFEISEMYSHSKWDLLENESFVEYISGAGADRYSQIRKFDFKYFTEDEFNQKFLRVDDCFFSVFHLNIRSLNSNVRSLCQFLQLITLKFDVIVLTEICAYNITYYNNILPGYRLFYRLPLNSKVGGVGMFIKSCYDVQEVPQFNIAASDNNKVENMWLEVTDANANSKIIIGGVYRHPNQNFTAFRDNLESTLDKLSSQSVPCIIAGDMNIDLVKSDSHSGTSHYVDNLLINNFMPTILMPTRITKVTATLIDHIYYYDGDKGRSNISVKSGNLLTDISDHLPNFTILNKAPKKVLDTRPKVRIFSKRNITKFQNTLEETNWNMVYGENDIDVAYNSFHGIITKAFNTSFPFKTVSRKRARDKPWITSALKISSRIKNSLYRQWLKSKNPVAEIKYKNYRNTFKKIALEAENLYYKELFDTKTNSIKKLWENLNMISSLKTKQKSANSISKLRINNMEIKQTADICNAFNKYFSSVGQELVANMVHTSSSITATPDFINYCGKPLKNSMYCDPVTNDELLKLINMLKNGKSPGPDNIGPKLLKQVSHVLVNPLVYMYNLSIETGIVPEKLKIAKIVPIYKSGDSSLPCNYRPISLLSLFDKLLEKIMATRLTKYLDAHNVLYKYQFGFRKNYSTVLAVIDVVEEILEHLDKQDIGIGIYLDLKKAFDTVDHTILLYKMYNYGIRGVVYDWFSSYLYNRQQYTSIQNYVSDNDTVSCGVPQGSVLGPLLFLIYMNDIGTAVPDEKIKLFADDTNLFIYDKDSKALCLKVTDCISRLNQWFFANKLTLNLTKTCYMVFSCKKVEDIRLFTNNIEITKVHSCKYLGIYIDDELNWKVHIDHIINKLIKFTGIFYKLRSKLTAEWLKNIYYAFVHPYILYGIEIYANTFGTYLDRLKKLNNKILRITQCQPRRSHVLDLYKRYNLLPLDHLYSQQLLVFVFKCLYYNQMVPFVFHEYFTFNRQVHAYGTRAQNDLHIFAPNTSFKKRTVKYQCSVLWNSLPEHMKVCSSVKVFKKTSKQYLISLCSDD